MLDQIVLGSVVQPQEKPALIQHCLIEESRARVWGKSGSVMTLLTY